MLEFLEQYSSVIDVIKFLVLVGLLYFSNKSPKLQNIIQGVFEMIIKYKTEHTNKAKTQSFSDFADVYRLNKSTNQLEKTDEKVDIKELVNSNKDATLENILAKFLPDSDLDTAVRTSAKYQDDLDFMFQAAAIAEQYRDEFKLGDELSFGQVFNKLEEKKVNLDVAIQNYKKGVEDNEKKEKVDEASK